MPVSANGWKASPTLVTVPISAGGVTLSVAPAAARILDHVIDRFHATVEPLRPGWCWGYSYRAIIGGSALSNHASGTAVDLNAPLHPLGSRGTFTAPQVRAIRAILADCDGLVAWGGDWASRADEMHFEVSGSKQLVASWSPPAAPPQPPAAAPTKEVRMFVTPYGASAHRLVTDTAVVGLSATGAAAWKAAGLPYVALPSTDVDAITAALGTTD